MRKRAHSKLMLLPDLVATANVQGTKQEDGGFRDFLKTAHLHCSGHELIFLPVWRTAFADLLPTSKVHSSSAAGVSVR
jgi:hypothetical protein